MKGDAAGANTGNGASVWVTRERPKIDRIACPWLIRRFIDPQAIFHFVAADWVQEVAEEIKAIPYDVEGVRYSHRGEDCSFDTLISEFGLSHPPLDHLARIIRGANTARFDLEPQAAGLLAISLGLSAIEEDDRVQLGKRHDPLRRTLRPVPPCPPRNAQLAGKGLRHGRATDQFPSPILCRSNPHLREDRSAVVRRSRRADRTDAQDTGRRKTLARRGAVSARAELLHAFARSGSDATGDLCRLAVARGAGRPRRRAAVRPARSGGADRSVRGLSACRRCPIGPGPAVRSEGGRSGGRTRGIDQGFQTRTQGKAVGGDRGRRLHRDRLPQTAVPADHPGRSPGRGRRAFFRSRQGDGRRRANHAGTRNARMDETQPARLFLDTSRLVRDLARASGSAAFSPD